MSTHVLTCRTSGEGECEASEGSFMCEDMLRAGYQRFIVDPGVRQAYFPDTARKLYTDKVGARHQFTTGAHRSQGLGSSRQLQ